MVGCQRNIDEAEGIGYRDPGPTTEQEGVYISVTVYRRLRQEGEWLLAGPPNYSRRLATGSSEPGVICPRNSR